MRMTDYVNVCRGPKPSIPCVLVPMRIGEYKAVLQDLKAVMGIPLTIISLYSHC